MCWTGGGGSGGCAARPSRQSGGGPQVGGWFSPHGRPALQLRPFVRQTFGNAFTVTLLSRFSAVHSFHLLKCTTNNNINKYIYLHARTRTHPGACTHKHTHTQGSVITLKPCNGHQRPGSTTACRRVRRAAAGCPVLRVGRSVRSPPKTGRSCFPIPRIFEPKNMSSSTSLANSRAGEFVRVSGVKLSRK